MISVSGIGNIQAPSGTGGFQKQQLTSSKDQHGGQVASGSVISIETYI